eukprot:4182720-Amphidinium_carterae.1
MLRGSSEITLSVQPRTGKRRKLTHSIREAAKLIGTLLTHQSQTCVLTQANANHCVIGIDVRLNALGGTGCRFSMRHRTLETT